MKSRTFVPGHIVSPAVITLPADAPDIDAVVSAQIIRAPSAFAITDHPVHAHDLVFAANPAANAVTMAANSLRNATAGALTVVGAGADGGIQNHAVLAHTVTGTNPVVAAVPVKDTNRTFHLGVDTELGDLLTLNYHPIGELVPTS